MACGPPLPLLPAGQAGPCQANERAGAVGEGLGLAVPGNPVFGGARNLAESAPIAARLEHRVVAEAPVAARRPHQRAEDAAFEDLLVPVRPGETQRRDEMRLALRGFARAPAQ